MVDVCSFVLTLARSAVIGSGVAAGLAGCGPSGPAKPSFYQDLGRPAVAVDARAAASMINGYRANHGLPPLALDPVLMRVAEEQAGAMADKNDVNLSLAKTRKVSTRLTAAGYGHDAAAENVSAGYRTLAEAFSGWRDSKQHNAVMLDPNATRMGIGTGYTPKSKYRVFWSLVVAKPAG
ncbi:MAG: hypothetical protein C0606_05000 [Hyphomicrobiales bacterium]|nr:MAG: hypothetical protein C0606_05000 [Hyphomicrobiales bacterium]